MSLTNTLLVIFIVLKLVGVISWGWVWVLSPLWVPFVALIASFVFLFVVGSAVHK